MKLVFFIFLLFDFLFVSCSENSFEQYVFRTTADPFEDRPVVDATTDLRNIKITWKDDKACDWYELYRANDAESPVFNKQVYFGTGTLCVDNLPEGCVGCFLYKLVKHRGDKIFEMTKFGAGCNVNEKDHNEPNDTKETATTLSYVRSGSIANTFYNYYDDTLNEIDVDYFKVYVPACNTVFIEFTDNQIDNGDEYTNFGYQIEGDIQKPIKTDGFKITNENLSDEYYYVKIALWIPDKGLADGGNHNFFSYEIKKARTIYGGNL